MAACIKCKAMEVCYSRHLKMLQDDCFAAAQADAGPVGYKDSSLHLSHQTPCMTTACTVEHNLDNTSSAPLLITTRWLNLTCHSVIAQAPMLMKCGKSRAMQY